MFDRDTDLVGFEASDRKRDAIGILACPHDITRRVMILRLKPEALVHQIEQPVEPDGSPPEGVKIQIPHSHILL
jgi:hypothetical protein